MKTLNGKYIHSTMGYLELQFSGNELLTEVKTYLVNKVCNACYDGVMEFTGLVKTSIPPIWEHQCSNCGNIADYTERYPNHRSVEITNEGK